MSHFFHLSICVIMIHLFLGSIPSFAGSNNIAVIDSIIAKLITNPSDLTQLIQLKAGIKTETNTERKLYYGLVYCIGCYHTGQLTEGASIKNSILKNFSSNAGAVTLLNNDIYDKCEQCNGTGRIDISCKRCNGSGQCVACGGTGQKQYQDFDNRVEISKCPICGVSGKCKECSGTGNITETCKSCSGGGKLLSKGKIEDIYSKLLRSRDALVFRKSTINSDGDVEPPLVPQLRNTKAMNGDGDVEPPLIPSFRDADAIHHSVEIKSTRTNGRLDMSDTDVILKAKNIHTEELPLDVASVVMKRMFQIASGVQENAGIKRGGETYWKMELHGYASEVARYITNKKDEQMQKEVHELIKTGSVENIQKYLERVKIVMSSRSDIHKEGESFVQVGGREMLDGEVDTSCLRAMPFGNSF